MKGLCSVLALMAVAVFMPTSVMAALAHSDQGCASCHTPHLATTGLIPLWNGATTTAQFQMYSSPHFTEVGGVNAGGPTGSSKLCLSCHDGTTNTGVSFADPNDRLGTDLSGSHPFSFKYDQTMASKDTTLKDPTTAPSGLAGGGTIAHDLLDADGNLQCASCHDPHTSAVAGTKYLRWYYFPALVSGTTRDRGTFCRTCHAR
jgi:hypothetical protein